MGLDQIQTRSVSRELVPAFRSAGVFVCIPKVLESANDKRLRRIPIQADQRAVWLFVLQNRPGLSMRGLSTAFYGYCMEDRQFPSRS